MWEYELIHVYSTIIINVILFIIIIFVLNTESHLFIEIQHNSLRAEYVKLHTVDLSIVMLHQLWYSVCL